MNAAVFGAAGSTDACITNALDDGFGCRMLCGIEASVAKRSRLAKRYEDHVTRR